MTEGIPIYDPETHLRGIIEDALREADAVERAADVYEVAVAVADAIIAAGWPRQST